MRKILAVLGIAGLVIMACGGGGGASSPEDAVTGMFDALKAGDIDGMMQYMPESERGEVSDEDKEMFQQMAGMFESMEVEVLGSEIDGETAVVMVNITFMGETSEEEVELMKENGSWVISDGGGFF